MNMFKLRMPDYLYLNSLRAGISIESELKCHRGLLEISDFEIAVRNDHDLCQNCQCLC